MTNPKIDRPSYYEIPGLVRACDLHLPVVPCANIADAIDGLGLNFNLGCVAKYVTRQGRKPNTPALVDLKKARDCLQREIERLERGVEPCGTNGEE